MEAEKAADIAREELEKTRRQAAEALSQEAAAHEAVLARLTAKQEKAQVRAGPHTAARAIWLGHSKL